MNNLLYDVDDDVQYVTNLLNNCSYAELSPISPICCHKNVDSFFCRNPEMCQHRKPIFRSKENIKCPTCGYELFDDPFSLDDYSCPYCGDVLFYGNTDKVVQ